MRVDPEIRRCVAFIGVETNGRFTPTGTGFLGGMHYQGVVDFHFLVTAAHVLNDLPHDVFAMRLNRKDGSAGSVLLNRQDAIKHPTKLGNDVAIVPISPDPTVHDVLPLEIGREILERQRRDFWDVALGDEVCAVGLYTSHYGLVKNMPVVRIGNLAALPEEPLKTPTGYADAYLIELRTIAGLSGSPVFVVAPPVQVKDGKVLHQKRNEPGMATIQLGVLVAYHIVESKDDQVQVPRFQTEPDSDQESDERKYSLDERNTGFGIVIPMERVFDILERKDVTDEMDRIAKEFAKKGVKPASAPLPASEREKTPALKPTNPEHREDFKRLLGAAVKKKAVD